MTISCVSRRILRKTNSGHASKKLVQTNGQFFSLDAARFVYGSFLGYPWCFVRSFIPSPADRKRFTVLGALNAVTKDVLVLTNETYVNSQTVCQMPWKIARNVGHGVFTVVLD